jgi:mono/diheme cytochrome c family protein
MELLGRIVRATQLITAVTAAAFAILLFTNEPQKAAPVPKTGAAAGEAIFATRCASCHGSDGGGGFGPTLAGVVTSRFPDPADQEAVVANGRGAMPSFSDSLTPEQIRAVVEFTRTGLG